ncbi:MAG TPA: ABC transporter substrate-binding protein, partial [Chloroflexota bacterium]|nr:ABC transporter substrate-binding protein [Chloroflexota bacterium]
AGAGSRPSILPGQVSTIVAVLSIPGRLALLAVVMVTAFACAPRDIVTPSDVGPLRIGIVTKVDTLPLFAAEYDHLYRNYHVEVTLVPFGSGAERDAALIAGQLDGMVHDLVAAALLNRDGDHIRVVKLAFQSTSDWPMVSLVAPGDTIVGDIQELRKTTIVVPEISASAHAVDRLLESRGVRSSDVRQIDVASPGRVLETLEARQAGAAALVEPFTSVALARGGRIIVDDRGTTISQSVLSFRREVLTTKGTSVRQFLRSHERAVEAVNANPARYRPLVMSWPNVPAIVGDSLEVPRYPTARRPSEDEVGGVVRWLVGHGHLAEPLPYERIVDASYVPR